MAGKGVRNVASFENVACTVCGCVCDDPRITVENGRITRAEVACGLAEPWFLGQDQVQPPVAWIEGQPVSLEVAVVQAANLLRAASAPLIYGLLCSSTEGQRAVVALAERIRATIDTTASRCHATSLMAIQDVGEVKTRTLGEVKNRADLVIFWERTLSRAIPATWSAYSLPARRSIGFPGDGWSERSSWSM